MIKGRDRYNPADMMRAAKTVADFQGGLPVTAATRRDLEEAGVVLPPLLVHEVNASSDASSDDVVIGGFFYLDVGKTYPDNIIKRCDCGTFIEIRPHNSHVRRALCLFCAEDFVLSLKNDP
jgi:hypothetical protein